MTWLHLLSNLLFLVIFGLPGERALGSFRFLSLFVIRWDCGQPDRGAVPGGRSSAQSSVAAARFQRSWAPTSRFSPARLGLVLPLGLYLEFVRVPAFLLIGIWVLLQLLFSYAGPSYGAYVWWAHIGGFLFGLVFALFSRDAIARRLRG